MTTALTLLTDAATTAGVIDPQESLPAAQAQFILRRLNRMIASWANERLLIYNTYTDTLALTGGTASYSTTLLANGNARQWDSAFVRISDIDYPLDIVGQQTYNAIEYKPTAAIPVMLYVDTGWPNSTLYFFPVPYGSMTAYISARKALTGTLLLATDVSLPQGYEAAIVDSLAADIGPSFGLQPNPQLIEQAREARTVLKRNNHTPLVMTTTVPGGNNGLFNVYAGRNT